jgi:hypothetical protein
MRNVTLIVTHAEVCRRHGVGSLLMTIFAREPATIVLYSRSFFDGECAGTVALHLEHPDDDSGEAEERLVAALREHEIERIFCVPHLPDDAVSGIAAAKLTGAPLVTYVMDDQNLFFDGIPDHLLSTLIARSSLCLAISEILRSGYQEKFGRPFWILPPVNEQRLFAPPGFTGPENKPPRGVIIGNIWSPQVLERLQQVVHTCGLRVDWYGNAGRPFVQVDEAELAANGITLHPNLTDDALVQELRGFDYGIMPSGTLNERLDQDWLFRGSLPSRLIYMLTTANLPLIVLGDPRTAAGQFVSQFGLGVTTPYDAPSVTRAVEQVCEPAAQRTIRSRAARLSPVFASEPVSGWIWKSAESGYPADDRYEAVFGADAALDSQR